MSEKGQHFSSCAFKSTLENSGHVMSFSLVAGHTGTLE